MPTLSHQHLVHSRFAAFSNDKADTFPDPDRFLQFEADVHLLNINRNNRLIRRDRSLVWFIIIHLKNRKENPPLLNKILSEKARILKFVAVGSSGTIVNLAVVWLGNALFFKALGEPHQTWMSYALATIVSIFSNYIFNYLWTWKDRRGQGVAYFFRHLLKYYLTSMAAAGLQFLIANGLIVSLFAGNVAVPVFWKMGAALAGIATAGIVSFLAHHFWSFNVSVDKKAV